MDTNTLSYEFPLNERYRTMLKLEYAFQFIRDRITQNHPTDFELSIKTLLELQELLNRTQFHTELLDEIVQYQAFLSRLSQTPTVDRVALDKVLSNINICYQHLTKFNLSEVSLLKHELFGAYHKRNSLFCGTLSFDIPLLHYWLHQTPNVRQEAVNEWIGRFEPVENAILLLFHLLRQSAIPKYEVAKQGKFHCIIPSTSSCRLIKISYDPSLGVYPELSGSKQRFYLRFTAPKTDQTINSTAIPRIADTPFELTLCTLS